MAKARGRVGGRPSKRNEKAEVVETLTRGGMGPTQIFIELNKAISIPPIKRIRREMWDREKQAQAGS